MALARNSPHRAPLRHGLSSRAGALGARVCPFSKRDAKREAIVTHYAAAEALGSFGARLSTTEQRRSIFSSPYDRDIRGVALPALLGSFLEPITNLVNAVMVSQLGAPQLSAVSLGTTALSSCTLLFNFLLFLTVPEIASAVVKGDSEEVSRVASESLWIAGGLGLLLGAALCLGAGPIVQALHPPEQLVACETARYLHIRSLAVPATLLSFVATGVFRGFKDTRTPLAGTAASVAVSLGMHLLLINALDLGVTGAAVASTAASLVGCGVQWGALLLTRRVRPHHLLRPPPLAAVVPLLQRGAALATRNLLSLGMVVMGSALCVRKGAAFQAAFEITRHLFFVCTPLFDCLSVATQSLCATALGRQDVPTARGTLSRLVGLGLCAGALAGAAIWGARGQLVAAFTADPHVVAHVMAVLPLICAFLPIDAAASIMDGSLVAAKQTTYMSAVQIGATVVQFALLTYLARSDGVTTLTVWTVVKVMALARALGSGTRACLSPHSAYRLHPQHHQQQHAHHQRQHQRTHTITRGQAPPGPTPAHYIAQQALPVAAPGHPSGADATCSRHGPHLPAAAPGAASVVTARAHCPSSSTGTVHDGRARDARHHNHRQRHQGQHRVAGGGMEQPHDWDRSVPPAATCEACAGVAAAAGALAAAAPSSARCTACGAAAAAAVRGEGAGAESGTGTETEHGDGAGDAAYGSGEPGDGKGDGGQDGTRAPVYELVGARRGRAGA